MSYFNNHNHTEFSNLRLIDCINKPEELINKAIELGLSGIAITDHESLSAHIRVNKYAKKIREQNPDFIIALGNEVYLTETREQRQKYYHFILIAKDEIGYRGIKELSSIAWQNSYFYGKMERVPLLKNELKDIMPRFKGHIIATTACIGGELGQLVLSLNKSELEGNLEDVRYYHNRIVEFINMCIDVFGKDDFYIECAPATFEDQIIANKRFLKIAKRFDVQMCIGTDAHYLIKEDRYIHKSYLNSKDGDREVDSFYEFTYLMTEEEATNFLLYSYDLDTIHSIYENSNRMKDKIEFYSLERHQDVVEVEVKDYPKQDVLFCCPTSPKEIDAIKRWNILNELGNSDNQQERYWVNQCLEKLSDLHSQNKLCSRYSYSDYLSRLAEEARVMKVIGKKLNTCIFAYPNTLQHYINLFWDCGSTVGAGRGSSCSGLNHYLMGITQLDPLEWDLPYWRFLNDERIELPDIDLDLAPSKIQKIFSAIRKERGKLGLVQVCTFGTEGTKSAILAACRGYRSAEYPEGIDVDEAQYLSSLIPSERGFLWPIEDVVYGNEEKGRKPIKVFISAVNQYEGLLDIIIRIQGLVNKRSSHASGVILFDENIYDTAAIMRTPKGALITQWDLHDQEAAGSVKYDFLLTSVQDIIIQTISLLQNDQVINQSLSLREVYDKYLHPSVLPRNDQKMWDALSNGEVIGCFQFDSSVGAQAAKKIRPTNPLEMSAANGLMRLMTQEPGEESPMDKYVRFKNNISLWYQEMNSYGLTKQEQKVLEPYFLPDYGVPPSQEAMMKMLMDKDICDFSLAEANNARKIVGKKLMNKIPELHSQVLNKAKSNAIGKYVWKCGIGTQMGYSFSTIHALAYSFVGMQTLYLATHFNPVYWNTAYLIVNSGAIDVEAKEQTDYIKVAKAIGEIRNKGIEVSLVDINYSDFGFKPDANNGKILFGLKGLTNVNNDLIKEIITKRPYISLVDFLNRVNPNRQAMIALIKGGAFDQFCPRMEAMVQYLWLTCDKKKRLTLQNMASLIKYDLIPHEKEFDLSRRVYEFNRYLKDRCKILNGYSLDTRAIDFLNSIGEENIYNESFFLETKAWDKVYQKYMDVFRDWIKENGVELLDSLNTIIFMQDWNKYAKGNISSWEMEALCFYYHDHELINVDKDRYGLVDFFSLPEEPLIEKTFKKGQSIIPIYKLSKICGTCIAKNKTKNVAYILTTTGVVPVKFRSEYFSLFDRQTFKKNPDGSKTIVERSWFNKGNMIMVQGIRRGDEFITKKYASSKSHQLYHIDEVLRDGSLVLRSERYAGDETNEEEV